MRKWLFLIISSLLLAACSAKTSGEEQELKEINIGIQQSLSPLWIAKEKGWFEEAFEKEGIKVKWTEFQSGPPQFEGLAAGKLDFSQVGNSPVIGGQAADVPFKEIALSQDGLKANAILVKKGSSIQSIEDLKGKKVAVAKGSSGFDFLHKALKKAGVSPDDVEIIQLQPDEAMPAFENGAVDAWSIWEPFVSLQTIQNDAEILANGETLHSYSPGFTLVRNGFAEEHPEEVERFLEVYNKTVDWQKANKEEAVSIYSEIKELDKDVVESVLNNTEPLNEPITEDIIKAQQETADFQYDLGVIDKEIDVSEVVDNQFIEKVKKEGAK
ncbi:aliphatic sulfonate ABC transporter substrate-binding protein [Domibacillus sp. DTU_2020_1001157_1_SI_ALB_TIR_016]|uniref:aliphatic sulfonate ABC transporter substrate-binding protein n=1 Tax=Domibacillus sp. DTU_2020_1001157_1_SI_ALB_TIR_016 TaxID=3077789 RepID=UPI0028E18997|nr:aliphatic sulfonate ABC transporter substrate-binding protein [Domibacillus sp. DTU_2020_1001157_1_SI_ALB_TIR_016]WNS78376.1 aliphatic sulfonate ABC transporter substrate-binding protein [Domibacillus sp. DTU_2020_1001157_1_SI_ALB_TIR_016]